MLKKILFLLFIFTHLDAKSQLYITGFEPARTEYNKGNYQQALDLLEKEIKTDSTNDKVWNLKGHCYKRMEKPLKAYECFNKAVYYKPKNAVYYFDRAESEAKLNHHNNAIQDLNLCISMSSNDTLLKYAYALRGAYKISLKDNEGAKSDLKKAQEVNKEESDKDFSILVYTNLAEAANNQGNNMDAIAYLRKVIQTDSTYIGGYLNLGFILQELNQDSMAIGFFDHVIFHRPKDALAYSNRSLSKQKLGDLNGALSDIETSLSIYPTNSYAYRTKAMIYIKLRKRKEACINLKKANELGYSRDYDVKVNELLNLHCN